MEEILVKCRDAVERGATEVCIQGGIHPNKDHTHYREILVSIKQEFPDLHIHAFSPEEIDFGHKKSGMPLEEYLRWLVDAGLGTMPGTAAEILDDEVRMKVSPKKIKRDRWIEIVTAAHRIGLRSTSTLMYGHVERVEHVANHLTLLRDIQDETGGFTEFVPLGFIHEKNALYNEKGARHGSSMAEDLRLIAVARLFLRPGIVNVQMSWVKMGPKLAQMALCSGANDFGGTLMEESISRESGADFGENLPPEEIRRLIREVGRTPVERSTSYRILRRFDDPALDPPSLEPERRGTSAGPRRWRTAPAESVVPLAVRDSAPAA
jgi:FO synthase